MIYFDYNATTPVDERVLEAMLPFYKVLYGNPSSLHRIGRVSRGAVETAREQVALLVGASPSQVVFTSGGTEANNLALQGLAGILPLGSIAAGATEHSSVLETVFALQQPGWKVNIVKVDQNGVIGERSLRAVLSDDLRFATIMLANNETGVIQDISSLTGQLRGYGITVHCDAIQGVGKIAVEFHALGSHLMSLSAHKIGGPKGVGALVIDKSVVVSPMLHGGGQERGLRGGTENVAAIVGFGKASEIALASLDARALKLTNLRQRLEQGLDGISGVTVFAKSARRLPNTVQFAVNGIDGEMLVMELDRSGIAVSSGSACSSEGNDPSHVLLAMGVTPIQARGAIRISLGAGNTESDIEQFLSALNLIIAKIQPGTLV